MKDNWLAQNNNYDRVLIGIVGLFGVAILYEPVYWAVLNLWCSIYGIFY